MDRIEVNLATGEQLVVALTEAEVAEVQSRIERAKPEKSFAQRVVDELLGDKEALAALKKALVDAKAGVIQ